MPPNDEAAPSGPAGAAQDIDISSGQSASAEHAAKQRVPGRGGVLVDCKRCKLAPGSQHHAGELSLHPRIEASA